jgi:hypothetical protein
MKRRLKVYGWSGYRLEAAGPHRQTREIVAAPTMVAAARAAGCVRARQLWNLCETGNKREIETAMAEPGVVFWRALDDWNGPYIRASR